MRPSTACSVASALRALQHLEAPSSVDEVVGGFLSGQFGRLPLQVRPMPSVYAQFAIGWRNWCGARGNLQGASGLIKNWQVADVGKRAIRVELSVCLVLHEATHFHRIDQARDDAVLCSSGSAITGLLNKGVLCSSACAITLHTRRRHAGNGVVWSAACATSLRLPRQS